MLRPELYQKTVDILVQAYFNDTLHHNDCGACAVGNICAGNGAFRANFLNWDAPNSNRLWQNVFVTNDGQQIILADNYNGETKKVIDATGYSWQELAKIEFGFESAPEGNSEEDWMYNGLMAVIDVLDEIHENKDTETTTKTKQRFNKLQTT